MFISNMFQLILIDFLYNSTVLRYIFIGSSVSLNESENKIFHLLLKKGNI